MKTKLPFLLLIIMLSSTCFAQIKLKNSPIPPREKISSPLNNSDLKLHESLDVFVNFPKSLFSINQINKLLESNNRLIEISAQSIIQKTGCDENAIKNKYLADCWIKNTSTNAISLLAQNYVLVNNNNSEYFTIQAIVQYKGLAPKTALISVILNQEFLQNVNWGNWVINEKTVCDFKIPSERWSEFVFQPMGGERGFAIRGIAGTNSVCSLPKKTDAVNFWVNKTN